MSEGRSTNRRELIATVVGGAILGSIWGAAFPAVATESRPTIAVVGYGDAQIVLIDSTDARALVLLGDLEQNLLDQIPAMMTLFRQRIDIIVGSRSTLDRTAMSLRDRWRIQHAVSLDSSASSPSLAMPMTTVPNSITLDLGQGMLLRGSVGHRMEWLHNVEDKRSPLWSLHLEHPHGSVILTPDSASLEATSVDESTLLISPGVPESRILRQHRIQSLAANYDNVDTLTDLDPKVPITRIYPEDIARFFFSDRGVELPPWSESVGPVQAQER